MSVLERNDAPVARKPLWVRYGRAIVVAGVFACAAMVALFVFQPGAATVAAEDVGIATIQRTEFLPALRVPAVVVAAQSATLATREGGTVAQVYRRNGDAVRPGDVILRLENAALVRDVATARLALAAQTNELVSAEGQISRQLSDARREVREARYRFERARSDLGRQQQLSAGGFASPSALERAQAEHAFAEEELRSVSRALEASEAEGRSRLARVRDARAGLGRLDALQTERLAALDVKASAGGTLTGLDLTPGTPVDAAAVIGRVEDDATMELLINVPEARQREIRPGGRGAFEIDGVPGRVQIQSVEPTVIDGEVRVRARFVGGQPLGLRAGRSLFVNLALGAPRRSLVVPASAVVDGDTLFVMDGPASARARRVRLGERSGSIIEVLSGVEAGDRVIRSSVRPLDDVKRIRIQVR